ncbi:M48 family metallopeptidase [Mycoplasma sp. Mirounga ES2805-ORL]|uniref:M48 metallopeptidase family protein n=1 Tax=Mycoplasma sp. Mirounga ES2805-ORL TaxID=754514 RepID=UPI00197C7227|nr:M48 family metallopeptidase [Mycoplasma sp. Mirounga ES2805-ORL]QSF13593.1 DUF45 domain-containing protein [Mycoplasma sp. Mirounga ES2805-ORL]
MEEDKYSFLVSFQFNNKDYFVYQNVITEFVKTTWKIGENNKIFITTSITLDKQAFWDLELDKKIKKQIELDDKKSGDNKLDSKVKLIHFINKDNQTVTIFGQEYLYEFMAVTKSTNTYFIDEKEKKLIIFVSEKIKKNLSRHKNILLNHLNTIYSNYLTVAQKKYAELLGIKNPTFYIKVMRGAYGKNVFHLFKYVYIWYHPYTLAFSKELIDTLIVHELTHCKHRNHSKDFYNCSSQIIDNFRAKNKTIRNTSIVLKW